MPMFTFSVPVTVPADRKHMQHTAGCIVTTTHHTCYSTWNVIETAQRFLPLHNTTARKPLANTQRTGRQQVLPDPMVKHALDDSRQQGQRSTAMTSDQLAGCLLLCQPSQGLRADSAILVPRAVNFQLLLFHFLKPCSGTVISLSS